ncbi:MAG TPA: hypothetical protein PLS51_01760 [Flavobacterium sp.]|jgi:hypothetical protein|nr:hypothetical protein [Flavobacterium sp.]HPJ09327.1 hypothetical protein [Flavobacterium sp.]
MSSNLYERVRNCSAHRKPRDENKDYILANPAEFAPLVRFAFEVQDKDSHKACWILEIVAYERLKWFIEPLDFICANLSKLNDESAIRPISKICQLLVDAHFKKPETGISLSPDQLQKIIEADFDWLIGDTKVAAKAYAMRTLFVIGQHIDWIHPELKTILDKDYQHHSAAYKAAAREILKKLAKTP